MHEAILCYNHEIPILKWICCADLRVCVRTVWERVVKWQLQPASQLTPQRSCSSVLLAVRVYFTRHLLHRAHCVPCKACCRNDSVRLSYRIHLLRRGVNRARACTRGPHKHTIYGETQPTIQLSPCILVFAILVLWQTQFATPCESETPKGNHSCISVYCKCVRVLCVTPHRWRYGCTFDATAFCNNDEFNGLIGN